MSRSADLEFDGVLVWETPFGDLAATPSHDGCYYRFQGTPAAVADLHDLHEVLLAALALGPLIPAAPAPSSSGSC